MTPSPSSRNLFKQKTQAIRALADLDVDLESFVKTTMNMFEEADEDDDFGLSFKDFMKHILDMRKTNVARVYDVQLNNKVMLREMSAMHDKLDLIYGGNFPTSPVIEESDKKKAKPGLKRSNTATQDSTDVLGVHKNERAAAAKAIEAVQTRAEARAEASVAVAAPRDGVPGTGNHSRFTFQAPATIAV